MHSLSSFFVFPGKEMLRFLNRKEIKVVHTDTKLISTFCPSPLPSLAPMAQLSGVEPFSLQGFPIPLEHFLLFSSQDCFGWGYDLTIEE